jgi:hypothetical protein
MNSQLALKAIGLSVPAVVGGALGGLGGWWFKEELKQLVTDDKTAWVIPVAGTMAGLGFGFYLSSTGLLRQFAM